MRLNADMNSAVANRNLKSGKAMNDFTTPATKAYRVTPDQEALLRSHPPGDAIIHSLNDLLTRDARLLSIDANERSITFRFAMYLQSHMRGWDIDCEFNRDGIEPKRLGHLELYPDSDDEEAKTVFPDVIAHQRGTNENHLVVELKKSTSRVDREIDRRKLRGYRQELGYTHALFVELGAGAQGGVTKVEWL